MNGNWNKENAANFQQALEDVVNGPNTKAYDIEYRGQAGFKVYIDQPTGRAVIFDPNGSLTGAWELSADQVKGAVVNGKLW